VDGPPLGTAAISVGTNPTFEVRQRRVEAYVLDFDGDLYGDALGVEFRTRLRGMERFDSVEALVAQMHEDVSRTREIVQS
jgi:riboflavin kinase/FMN adenylyltransferase